MRRLRPRDPSLFPEAEPNRYLLDTSGWLKLDEQSNATEAWAVVIALIEEDRLFSPRRVVTEVVSMRDRIEPYVERLVRCDRNDVPFLMKLGAITRKYRRLSKPLGRKTKADPFLIALALLDGYIIVAEESLRNRPIGKIPGVCLKEGIQCRTLAQLVAAERPAATRD
jgi:hypothetical protein